jgi:uncharacterized integral membrane protein
MKNTKLILIAILAIAVLLLILQNTGVTEIKWLFFRIEMPMIILLLVNTAIGFLLGVLVSMKGKPKIKNQDY